MTTRAFFINSETAVYGQEELNQVQKFLFNEGIANTQGSTWEDWFANGDLKVTENSEGADMSVDVAVGWAIIETIRNAQTFKVMCENKDSVNLVVSPNTSGDVRVDTAIIKLSRTIEPNTLTNNVVTIELITGSGTSALSDGEIQTELGTDDDFIRLADISVDDSETTILDADISDERVRMKTNDVATYSPSVAEFQLLTSDPTESLLQKGSFWFNSTQSTFKYFNGTDILSFEPVVLTAGQGIDVADGEVSLKMAESTTDEGVSIRDALSIKPGIAYMTSDFDNGDAATISETFDSGAAADNKVLLIFITINGNDAAPTVTYGGETMTLLDSYIYNGNRRSATYFLADPANGSNSLAATFLSGTPAHGILYWVGSGVDQDSAEAFVQRYTADSDSFSQDVELTAEGQWGISSILTGYVPPITFTSGENCELLTQTTANQGCALFHSGRALYGEGTDKTFAASLSNDNNHLFVTVLLSPAVSPANAKVEKSDATTEVSVQSFVGFAKETKLTDEEVEVVSHGIIDTFTNLIPGQYYYLSDTPGEISLIPGTNEKKVGLAVSTTELLVIIQ